MTRHKLEIYNALRAGADPAYLPAGSTRWIADFWETIGGLARHGHLDPKLMWDAGSGSACQWWWVMLAAEARRQRADGAGSGLWQNFEWLAGVMAEFIRRAGATLPNEAALVAGLERSIRQLQDQLRVEESLRSVTVAPQVAVPVASPAAARRWHPRWLR
jgi:hypothetical protein